MHWFVYLHDTAISCAETGAALMRTGDYWRRRSIGTAEFETTHELVAESMLAALGYRWNGAAIVPVAVNGPQPAGLTLEPVDLSKPREAGHYWIRLPDGETMWLCVSTPGRWSEYSNVTRAYRLPEELP